MSLDDDADKAMSLILTVDDLYELPAPEWIIQDTLPANSLVEVFGPSGEGKTFTVLDMALHVAYGRTWHGFQVRQTGVLYVCGEGLAGMKARIQVWRDYHEGIESPPLYITRHEIGFADPDAVSELIEAIDSCVGEVGMVIVDTLHANFGHGNENSPDDMGRFLVGMRTLQRHLTATVIAVHHTGHENQHRARGHSSLKAALDTEIQVAKSTTDEKLIGVTVTKQRCGSKWDEPQGFRFHVDETGWFDNFGEPITSCVLTPVDAIPELPGSTGDRRGSGRHQVAARGVVRDLGSVAQSYGDNDTRFIAQKDFDDAMRIEFPDRKLRSRMKRWLETEAGLLTPSIGGYSIDAYKI